MLHLLHSSQVGPNGAPAPTADARTQSEASEEGRYRIIDDSCDFQCAAIFGENGADIAHPWAWAMIGRRTLNHLQSLSGGRPDGFALNRAFADNGAVIV
jgi:hypothetical protein